MAQPWIDLIWQTVIALGIGMARILAILVVVPVFTGMQLKGFVRNACALALSLILLPQILATMEPGGLATAMLILKETARAFYSAAFCLFLFGCLTGWAFW